LVGIRLFTFEGKGQKPGSSNMQQIIASTRFDKQVAADVLPQTKF